MAGSRQKPVPRGRQQTETAADSGLKLVYIVNILYGKLKSENSLDYAQKPELNCTFMN
jgi:hypothetical protein